MRKEEKTELTRNRILAAALQEFGTKGYAAGTVNRICEAGINKGLVYHNFKDKDSLYLECVRKSCEELVQYVKIHMKTVCFVEYMNVRMRFFTDHEWEGFIFLEARTAPPGHLQEQIRHLMKDCDRLNREVFEKELDRIELRNGVSKKDAMDYFSEIQNLYNYRFADRMNTQLPPQEQLFEHEGNIRKVFDLLLYGIAKGGEK